MSPPGTDSVGSVAGMGGTDMHGPQGAGGGSNGSANDTRGGGRGDTDADALKEEDLQAHWEAAKAAMRKAGAGDAMNTAGE